MRSVLRNLLDWSSLTSYLTDFYLGGLDLNVQGE